MNWKVPLTDTTLDDMEAEAAAQVVRSGWVTMGSEVRAFEDEFAEMLNVRHAVAVTNGTAALHLAYLVAGLCPGDEVCVPALTFVATLNAGLYLGAKPILIDCTSENDLTLSMGDLERKITDKTKLIVTMPYGGFAPDMQRVCAIGARYGVGVIEDACHAPLAELNSRKIGTFGLASTWSFFGNKNLTTGEGGMIVTDDDDMADRLRLLRAHGMTSLTQERHAGGAMDYDVIETGYNYRMDEIRAAVGRIQLKKLTNAQERRRNAAARLRTALKSSVNKGLVIPFDGHRGVSAHHLFVVIMPEGLERDRFRGIMHDEGVQTSVHYPPLNQLSSVKRYVGNVNLPVLDSISERLVTLPMGPTLSENQIGLIAEAVEKALS